MKNPSRWIVLASHGKLVTYEMKSPKEFEQIKEEIHRKASMREKHFTTDKHGETAPHAGNVHNSAGPRETYKQLEEREYAKHIAEYLNKAHDNKRYEWLYIAMSPALLGYVREHLNKGVQEAIHKQIDKDIVNEKPDQVWERYFAA
ncbi:MAG: host attachment protein [Simkaniaceae bacterium]|nr:host attachment protein [Simkaniaceae bacterium]